MDLTKHASNDDAVNGARLFSAKSIDIRNVKGEIFVQPYDGDQIELTIEGDDDIVDKVTAEVNKRGVLMIDGHQGGLSAGDIYVEGNTTVIINGTVITSTQRPAGLFGRLLNKVIKVSTGGSLTLTLRVPMRKVLELQLNVFATTNIGKLTEKLVLTNKSSGDVYVESAVDAVIDAQGFGAIEVKSLDGSLDARVSSSADILIKGGIVRSLNAVSSGFGNIRVARVEGPVAARVSSSGDIAVEKGVVTDANLRTTGFGNIEIYRVDGPTDVRAESSGTIIVRNGIAQNLIATTRGFGDITIAAAAGVVKLDCSSSGSILVRGGTMQSLEATTRGFGSINVHGAAQTAVLRTSSSGDISVSRVIGHVDESARGFGSINILRRG